MSTVAGKCPSLRSDPCGTRRLARTRAVRCPDFRGDETRLRPHRVKRTRGPVLPFNHSASTRGEKCFGETRGSWGLPWSRFAAAKGALPAQSWVPKTAIPLQGEAVSDRRGKRSCTPILRPLSLCKLAGRRGGPATLGSARAIWTLSSWSISLHPWPASPSCSPSPPSSTLSSTAAPHPLPPTPLPHHCLAGPHCPMPGPPACLPSVPPTFCLIVPSTPSSGDSSGPPSQFPRPWSE